jgi:hypothetical protein
MRSSSITKSVEFHNMGSAGTAEITTDFNPIEMPIIARHWFGIPPRDAMNHRVLKLPSRPTDRRYGRAADEQGASR